ncbi:unnamed protein product [Paramecium primaurelia]|uniref:Ubiquitin-like protease family profile domain-containing protein n=1 Tax=Paramecium primaurelia TaxID=5886 RepID=A0A8S1P5T9_PARPR|nr:unnamed protein product [Paramecium primaurelia]
MNGIAYPFDLLQNEDKLHLFQNIKAKIYGQNDAQISIEPIHGSLFITNIRICWFNFPKKIEELSPQERQLVETIQDKHGQKKELWQQLNLNGKSFMFLYSRLLSHGLQGNKLRCFIGELEAEDDIYVQQNKNTGLEDFLEQENPVNIVNLEGGKYQIEFDLQLLDKQTQDEIFDLVTEYSINQKESNDSEEKNQKEMNDEKINTKNDKFSQGNKAIKNIYKIIKPPNCKRLLLRPNGNIIINYVEQGDYLIFRKTQLYVNSQNFISIPVDFEQTNQTVYEGGIDGIHFLPYGKGLFRNKYCQFDGQFKDGFASDFCTIELNQQKCKIQCQYQWGQRHGVYEEESDNYSIECYYQNNLKEGKFIQKQKKGDNQNVIQEKYQYYKNGTIITKKEYNKNEYQKNINQKTTRYLLTHQEFTISNNIFKGFNYGEWLNQLCVDYYLQLVIDYYKLAQGQSIKLLNTIECQEIFSSLITTKESKVVIFPQLMEINLKLSEIDKLIFIMNVDRSHFLVLVYQNEYLYMLNSLNNKLDQVILDQVAKIFPKLKRAEKGKEKMKIVNVAQQTNTFDCGIHSIYNTILQYKYFNKNVDEIEYQVTKKMMEKFRIHIKNVLINDYAHILPQISDSKQNHRF